MRIGEERIGKGRVVARVDGIAARALLRIPAEIETAFTRWREADFLIETLTDIRDEQIAGLSVEREAPGVAQAVGPDLVVAVDADERVVRGDAVRRAAERVDAQELAQQVRRDVLRVADARGVPGAGVAEVAAVAGGDVQVAVDRAEVVIRPWGC